MRTTSYLMILVAVPLITAGCLNPPSQRDYRQDMRYFVQNISAQAGQANPGFLIIPQNGHELLTLDGDSEGDPATGYINSIDGVGREDLFYGYLGDDRPTPVEESESILAFLAIAEGRDVQVLVTDYCSSESFISLSYSESQNRGFISFAADSRELDSIPTFPPQPHNLNADDVLTLSDARNFLYLINPASFAGIDSFLDSIRSTNYDLIIIDPYFDGRVLTSHEVESLGTKAHGGRRLVIAYMSIGEAEDYRYYWDDAWNANPPVWLDGENPDWEGNFKVKYWHDDWQTLIYCSRDSFLNRILEAGFDGVYLDLIDAYEYYE